MEVGAMRWASKAVLAETFALSRKTIDRRVDGMRYYLGKRYSPTAIIDTGRLVRVQIEAFADYLKYETALKNGYSVPDWKGGE